MNRQHIWKIVPLVLLLTSLAWWAKAQTTETTVADEPGAAREILPGPIEVPRTKSTTKPELEPIDEEYVVEDESAPARPSTPPPFPFLREMMTEYMESQRPRRNTQNGEQILDKLTREIVRVYKSGSDPKQRKLLRSKLRGVTFEYFKLRQNARQVELDDLAMQLRRLKASHERRQSNEDNIVAARVESLLRNADGLGWGSSSPKRGRSPKQDFQVPKRDGHLLFNSRKTPWRDALESFADQAGLSLVMDTPPSGTFTHNGAREYSTAEAINMLNRVLQTQHYVLIRRQGMLTLVNMEDNGRSKNATPSAAGR